MDPVNQELVHTIRLSDKEKSKLIWAVNASQKVFEGQDPNRLQITPSHTNAVITLVEDGGKPLSFSVIAYSQGRRGISLIHGRYIHPGTRCKVRFPSISGEWHERVGQTGQCIHVQGIIHALLIKFDEPINLDEFAMLTPEQETRHLEEIAQELPNMDSEEFVGLVSRVLYVEDQASDRKLLSHWLNRASIQVTTASDPDTAIDQIEVNEFDLMIVDMYLGQENGAELIRRARTNRFVQPVLAVSADNSEGVRDEAINAGANGFLNKPLEEHELVRNIKELMGIDPDCDDSPIYSTFSDDAEMVPLLTGYVRSLADQIMNIRDANACNDYDNLIKYTRALKGCGLSYGFPEITSAATTALLALDNDMPDMDEIKRLVNALIQVLSRIKVRFVQAVDSKPSDLTAD